MALDRSKMKAYAGGLSGGAGVIAGAILPDDLAVIITWLVGLTGGEAPAEVARPLARFILVAGGFFVGKLITYWSPPNEVSAAMYTEAIREEASRTGEL